MRALSGSTALIIPALNEEEVIGWTLSHLPAGLFDAVIVADNGSTDATAKIAQAHGALVVSEPQRGYGAACLKALQVVPSQCDVVVFMQADGSEDASEAWNLIRPLREDRADLVIGSRTLGTAAPGALLPHQKFGNWLACTLIRWLYGFRYTDLGPFRAIRIDALRRLHMRDRNYGWTIEMQIRALEENLRIIEIPVAYRPRRAGRNKVSGDLRASLQAGAKILWTVFRLAAKSRRLPLLR